MARPQIRPAIFIALQNGLAALLADGWPAALARLRAVPALVVRTAPAVAALGAAAVFVAAWTLGSRYAGGSDSSGYLSEAALWLAGSLHVAEPTALADAYALVKRRFPNGMGLCVLTDVSEHHKREEQWRADMARVQMTEEILDNIPFPVFVKDTNCAYVAVNRAFCNVRGVGPDEINWSHVGDVTAVVEQLTAIKNFISGDES